MMAKTLAQTTLDPERRTLLRVAATNPVEANRTILELMGKDTSARFEFIMDEAANLDAIDA